MATTTISILPTAGVALLAATVAAYAARGNSTRAGFDLARTLYNDLTSGDTAASRGSLEFYRRGRSNEDPDEVMDHYFKLLWQFEQINAGRQSLKRQRLLNGTGPAARFLDEMIDWHVREWGNRWIDIRSQLESARDEEIHDEHSLDTFCQLLASVAPGHWQLSRLKEVVAQQRAARELREREERERTAAHPPSAMT
ncbi:hypothetical protein ABZS61_17685 [Streptomyces sp. NPDC005566]|uniref:hypothetical protein n=1 Tax=Streptomyces sp. NPDC005566 TaxID=3156886 RepID=UPI0033B286FF